METVVRLSVFVAVLCLCTAAERLWPRRPPTAGGWARWAGNLAFGPLGAVAVRLLLPLAAVDAAIVAQQHQWGMLSLSPFPAPVNIAVAVVALDLTIYWQHRLFHRLPWLWRIHRMHHTDLTLDASSGLRFHPAEIVLSMLIKIGAVLALGASAIAVVIFEVLLNATALFNHANLKIPPRLDRYLRLLVVTPDMHRVHHSIYRPETDSNFGFNLPWWDHLFASYRDQPRDGHPRMTVGLPEWRNPARLGFLSLLLQPVAATPDVGSSRSPGPPPGSSGGGRVSGQRPASARRTPREPGS